MIKDELKERLRKRPFEPFRINTVDGKHFDIVKPFSAVAMETEMYFLLPNGRGRFLQLQQVKNVEDVKPNGWGKSRPKKGRRGH
ncbi:MAG TPA: hypothetical protein VGQ99_09625 [Tepidisphaeraceae bacterium]|jgi:hypothetical protein|nr:hypothetical protein [Tepidisphaeraceae bacterium]